jgi:hypothetical protein
VRFALCIHEADAADKPGSAIFPLLFTTCQILK